MKITELKQVPKNRRGKFFKNGVDLYPHEENTAEYLTLYGFTINAILPVETPKVHNPDVLLDGAIWEMKSPTSSNLKTIKKRIHEASEQATRLIVDLRRIRRGYEKVENDVAKRIRNKNSIRRAIVILNDGRVFYYKK